MSDVIRMESPNGDKYETSDAIEANNLQFGHGWKVVTSEPAKAAPAPSRPMTNPQSNTGSGAANV